MAAEARRRLLMLAYFFPPLGGAGVQRSLKFARYLPAHGWIPTVITVRSQDYWMVDETLARELDPRVSVLRTSSLTGLTVLRRLAPHQGGAPGQPRGSAGAIARLRRLSSWVMVPDAYVGWMPFALAAALRAHREHPFHAIYTTSSPDSAHLIGRRLARALGLPWVADFRDPWTRRLSYHPPTRWHDARQQALERDVLTRAALVTVTAEETRDDYLRRYPHLAPEKIQVVTNGYDEEDFQGLARLRPARERMEVLHAGQLNPERPARPALLALRRLLDLTPGAGGRVRMRFIGACYESDRREAQRLGLEEHVRFEPGRSHREVVGELLRSHVLLLMEHDSERGGLILPGKVFEYLRARRPILGLLPRGAAWNLIQRLGVGRCCCTDDAEAAARHLATYLAEFDRGGPEPTSLPEGELQRFERRRLTARLAGLLDPLAAQR